MTLDYMTPEEIEHYKLFYAQLEAEMAKKREQVNESSRKWRAANRETARARSLEWNRAHPERMAASTRRSQLKRKYGLTKEGWTEKFEAQGSCCAICQTKDPGSKSGWHTDHCHKTGRLRGILCYNCNHTVRNNSQFRLRDCADYVEKWLKTG